MATRKVLNLTQHAATADQIAVGVYDLSVEDRKTLSNLLTFDDLPSVADLEARAAKIADFAAYRVEPDDVDDCWVMVGCASWFAGWLESALRQEGITPLHAFSRREAVDVKQPDGSTIKTAVFRHVGFVGE